MSYMGNDSFWNEKFKNRNKMLGPERELVLHREFLGKGSALDLACGDGRNTMYLLEEGFQVTAVDFSEVGLSRLTAHAKDYLNQLNTLHIDLNEPTAFDTLKTYDLVVINHFRLKPELMSQISHLLNKHGVLFVSGFSERHTPDEKIRQEDLILPTDFDGLTQMKMLSRNVFEDQRGAFVTYLYKKY